MLQYAFDSKSRGVGAAKKDPQLGARNIYCLKNRERGNRVLVIVL